jgi:hypothetical protein
MKSHALFLCCLVLFLTLLVGGLICRADFLTEARDRLANGERDAATALFQKHLDSAPPSASIYYELGQVHASADQSAEAALAFNRALLLDPSFTPARDALNAANRDLGIPTAPLDWRNKVAAAIPPDALALGAALLFWVEAFLLLTGTATGLLSLSTDPRFLHAREVMILKESGTVLYRTPTTDPFAKITTLAPGTLINVLATSGRWFHGQLHGGQEGWFLQEGCKPVVPLFVTSKE